MKSECDRSLVSAHVWYTVDVARSNRVGFAIFAPSASVKAVLLKGNKFQRINLSDTVDEDDNLLQDA